jgi:hypothetical protein
MARARHTPYSTLYAIRHTPYVNRHTYAFAAVLDVLYIQYNMHYALRIFDYALSAMRYLLSAFCYVLCTMHCAVCTVYCAPVHLECAQCTLESTQAHTTQPHTTHRYADTPIRRYADTAAEAAAAERTYRDTGTH